MAASDFEKLILRSAVKAAATYEDMTEGEWLSHAPELFLQTEVARAVWKAGYTVYIDASGKRVAQALGKKRGPLPGDAMRRSDILVFFKRRDALKAVIEVKIRGTNDIFVVKKDAQKIQTHFRHAHHAKAGYLLVYTEMAGTKRRKKLQGQFRSWPEKLGSGWTIRGQHVDTHDGEGRDNQIYNWGIGLYRYR